MTIIKTQKPRLEYPCLWLYKVIGTDRDEIQNAVGNIIRDRSCKISLSRHSEGAKYVSLNVEGYILCAFAVTRQGYFARPVTDDIADGVL